MVWHRLKTYFSETVGIFAKYNSGDGGDSMTLLEWFRLKLIEMLRKVTLATAAGAGMGEWGRGLERELRKSAFSFLFCTPYRYTKYVFWLSPGYRSIET